jgi:hypothetical protein
MWLTGQINRLLSSTYVSITTSDVTIISFTAAETGVSNAPAGVNGSFTFTVSLTLGASHETTAVVTGTIVATPVYAIAIAPTSNGTVTATPVGFQEEGTTITLTIAAASGYELEELKVQKDPTSEVAVTGNGATRTFEMPANDVTVTATFKKTADQLAVEAAKVVIESGSYSVTQATANSEATVKTWLVSSINSLLSGTNITVSASDIAISGFTAAVAGVSGSPAGANGSFGFTVSLSKGGSSVTTTASTGTITATTYVPTGIGDVRQSDILKAYAKDGLLHINGLTEGQEWSVYNIQGKLLYKAQARTTETTIPLSDRGVYIVVSGNRSVKVIH